MGSAGAGGSSRRGTLPYGQGRSRGGTSGATAGSAVSSAPGVLLIDGTVPGSVTGGNGGTSAGTGMVLSADGYALTNYHVVESTDKLRVTVADTGKSYAATVVGADATHDVALLRLQDATDLTPVTIDRDDVSVGQAVTAIGNGGGGGQDRLYQASGTVQQLDDDITVSADATSSGHQLNGLIRTNAGVVPGYSGGPLFDKQGEVMGINTAASSGGAPEGFAIPIQQALTIADQIKAGKTNGTVRVGPRAVLGVQVASSPRAGTSNLPGRGRVPQQSSGSQGGQDAPGAQDAPGSGSAGAAGVRDGRGGHGGHRRQRRGVGGPDGRRDDHGGGWHADRRRRRAPGRDLRPRRRRHRRGDLDRRVRRAPHGEGHPESLPAQLSGPHRS
jgi:S1-C subfamily serine protease